MNSNEKEQVLQDIRNSIKDIQRTQTEILVELAKKPCKRHSERIKLLERVIFGLITVILMAFMYEVTGYKKIKTPKANATPLVKEQLKQVKPDHELKLQHSYRSR